MTKYTIAIIILSVLVGATFLLCIISCICRNKHLIWAKCRRKKTTVLYPSTEMLSTVNEETQSNNISKDRFSRCVSVPYFSNPVTIDDLSDYVKHSMPDELKDQFDIIPQGELKPCTRGREADVKAKNRYGNILPYDDNRVVLQQIPGDSSSDYINASFITGYGGNQLYIATQGPKKTTVIDFWRMVYQEKVGKIVNLVNVTKEGMERCEKYWPDSSEEYGDLSVQSEHTEVLADYAIRSFSVTKEGVEGAHLVHQFHFTSWPDHGVPNYPRVLLNVLKKMKRYGNVKTLILVHCSAGIGRTGTVILLDMMLDMAKAEGKVDVPYYLSQMRNEKANIVENWEQYVFVYFALVEELTGENTVIPSSEFSGYFENITTKDEGLLHLKREFKRLDLYRPVLSSTDCRMSMEPHNSYKNRFQHILCSERARPFLYVTSATPSDYINAVFVNGYKRADAFVVTQFPLPSTIFDFWRLIVDYPVSIIVILNEIDEEDQSSPIFWPEEGELNIHHITVTSLSWEVKGNIKQRKLEVRYQTFLKGKQTKEVTIIQLLGWSSNEFCPPTPNHILDVIERMSQLQQKKGTDPVVVTCYDGVTACGLFCASSFICEKILTEHEVDVFLAVQTVFTNRPLFILHFEQYGFCYEEAKSLLTTFDYYSNFK